MFVHILYVHMYNACTCTCMYLCRSANLSKAEECRQSIYSLINSYILKPNEGINQIVLIALYLTIFLTTEWQMLLDLIKETVKVCPETFVSGVQHSSSPQLSKHSKSKWYALNKGTVCTKGSRFPLYSIHSLNRTGSPCFTWLPWLYSGMPWHASAQHMRVRYTMFATTSYSASTCTCILLLRFYTGRH